MAKAKTAKKKDNGLYAIFSDESGQVEIYRGKPKYHTEVVVDRGNFLTELCEEAAKALNLKPGVLTKLNVSIEEIPVTK